MLRFLLLVTGSLAICIKWHKVMKFDTYSQLMIEYHVNFEDLVRMNPDIDYLRIPVGYALCVRDNDEKEEKCLKMKPVGDEGSCDSILVVNKLTIRQLQQLNPAIDCQKLKSGTMICVEGEYTPGIQEEITNF